MPQSSETHSHGLVKVKTQGTHTLTHPHTSSTEACILGGAGKEVYLINIFSIFWV